MCSSNRMKGQKMKRFMATFSIVLALSLSTPSGAVANDKARIAQLEAKVARLEKEVNRLLQQEKRASKYLKCVQDVEGNALTVPFKILNCIRK